ncbi:MAG TPA: putative 2OG-Fe(II) oxygenase, partial [Luteimonas sp.]
QAWHGLGSALQALDELEAADAALQRAIALAPESAAAWVNRGAVLRRLGRLQEARDCLLQARALGHDTPEVRNALLGLLQDMGQPAQALSEARALVARDPGFAGGHESLAHLLWEHGDALAPGEDPLAPLCAAARGQRANMPLQLACVRALLEAGRAADAFEWLQPLRSASPGQPALDWMAADALDRLDRAGEASVLYARVAAQLGDQRPDFLNAYARHAFRSGRIGLARDCAERATRRDPRNQEAWSLLGTAWRLAGDPREEWLFGYDRLVGELEIAPPAGHGDLAGFLQALDANLGALHLASRAPRAQSVRGGTQTPGRLFGRDDPLIRGTAAALRAGVEHWLAGLPDDPRHPFLAHRRRGIRFVGSWSVRLHSAGHHADHIHDEGWLSSAFYVALPPPVRAAVGPDASAHPGWLRLGQPMASLGLDLGPRRLVQPRPGTLVVFPSYLWHGTVPFEDPQPRVTVAFDMQPAP